MTEVMSSKALTRDSLLLQLLNGPDTVLRNRRSICRQTRRNTTLARLRVRTEFIYIALAGIQASLKWSAVV